MLKKYSTLFILSIIIFLSTISYAKSYPEYPLINLSSKTGSKIFDRSYSRYFFWPINLQFITQKTQKFCSIASSVIVLNALHVRAHKSTLLHLVTQDNFFTGKTKAILPAKKVRKQGSTLKEISRALKTYGVKTRIIYANSISVKQFRAIIREVLLMKNTYIIINYSRKILGQKGNGHMSPIAAYDRKTDRVLVMDVARFKYPPVWVKTKDLWSAMHTLDKHSNLYRGFLMVRKI